MRDISKLAWIGIWQSKLGVGIDGWIGLQYYARQQISVTDVL